MYCKTVLVLEEKFENSMEMIQVLQLWLTCNENLEVFGCLNPLNSNREAQKLISLR